MGDGTLQRASVGALTQTLNERIITVRWSAELEVDLVSEPREVSADRHHLVHAVMVVGDRDRLRVEDHATDAVLEGGAQESVGIARPAPFWKNVHPVSRSETVRDEGKARLIGPRAAGDRDALTGAREKASDGPTPEIEGVGSDPAELLKIRSAEAGRKQRIVEHRYVVGKGQEAAAFGSVVADPLELRQALHVQAVEVPHDEDAREGDASGKEMSRNRVLGLPAGESFFVSNIELHKESGPTLYTRVGPD